MEQAKTDLVMKFVLDGSPVVAECGLDVAPGDPLMKDFNSSHFFEASSFDMGMSLKEDDESQSPLNPAGLGSQATRTAAPVGQYARWRSATQAEYKKVPFRLEFDRFSFKRTIDRASPIFFEACCSSRTFDSAVLVKRIAQGDQAGGSPSVGYLRVDFTKVLLIGVNWDDGDMVTEQCDFICQGLTIAYRQQQQSGEFGATKSAHWTKDVALKSPGGRGR